jgi:Endonuclease NucS C-terminal domain
MLAAGDAVAALAARREGADRSLRYDVPGQAHECERPAGQRDPDGELVSQQCKTSIGVIDILATDRKTGHYVVIELEKNQTSDDTVGQLTLYMGWLEVNKSKGKARHP